MIIEETYWKSACGKKTYVVTETFDVMQNHDLAEGVDAVDQGDGTSLVKLSASSLPNDSTWVELADEDAFEAAKVAAVALMDTEHPASTEEPTVIEALALLGITIEELQAALGGQ